MDHPIQKGTVGWRFPPTNGGRIDGYKDPGIGYFTGSPLSSLARETIQNSLDARESAQRPVHVSFEFVPLRPDDFGRDELAGAIEACRKETTNDATARAELEIIADMCGRSEIPCLRVSDRNTTGLRGEHWRALVKMQGVSHKAEVVGAGGSHGIGKYAPFSVSTLRTVFYWTCYQEGKEDVERFQGKSVLVSHQGPEGETQGTGFYGIKENCSELTGRQVPEGFRLLGQTGRPVHGTSLVIAGFRVTQDWRLRIAASVIENYFYAIGIGALTVTIEPDDRSELFEVDKDSLEAWFDKLGYNTSGSDDAGDEENSALDQARTFWELSKTEGKIVEKQDADFGHCRLWIRVAEGLASKVSFVRRTGMLVTTQQRNLVRFPGFRDFVALCVFEDPEGNEFLRRMENPTHDQFEPDRLPEIERSRGRKALKRITSWIRDEIRKQAGPPEGGKKTVLSELAAYLPDFQPEEPFEDGGPDGDGLVREPGFGERVKYALKPVRRPAPRSLPLDDEGAEEGDGDGVDVGGSGGGGAHPNGGHDGTGGSGEGDGQGGSGTRGGGSRVKGIPLSGVRILSIEGRENCYRLSFRAEADGVVRLVLDEAGDSSAVRRDDVRAAEDTVSLDSVRLAKGERTEVEITADSPIGDRAWRLAALTESGGGE